MVGKNTQLIVRENIFGKLSNYLLLITRIKITVAICYILYFLILEYIECKSVFIADLRIILYKSKFLCKFWYSREINILKLYGET